jgi:hypothetical protein
MPEAVVRWEAPKVECRATTRSEAVSVTCWMPSPVVVKDGLPKLASIRTRSPNCSVPAISELAKSASTELLIAPLITSIAPLLVVTDDATILTLE